MEDKGKAQIERQLEFVEWLKSHSIYNEFASASTMQNMILVWEAFQADRPTPDIGIEWVGKCDNPYCDSKFEEDEGVACSVCNGTGEVRREATVEEVVEVFPKLLEAIKITPVSSPAYREYTLNEALTTNGGTLRVKEVI